MTVIIGVYVVIVLALTWADINQIKRLQYSLKPIAALGFILIAILGGAIYWDYGQWIVLGLIACAIGDVLLLPRDKPLYFKLGMLAFAIGHVFYIYAFHQYSDEARTFNPLVVLPALVGVAYFLWIRPKLPKDMVLPVLLYSVIIIFMMVWSFKVVLWMAPLAAILFALSDMFVAKNRFIEDDQIHGQSYNALMVTPVYFGAQLLFALSATI